MEIQNGPATNITATNAWLVGNLVRTNATNATLTVFYGTGNGGTNPVLWQYSNTYGVAVSTGLVSVAVSNATPATWYYFRWTATETTNTAWPAASSNFSTLARQPTNFPAAGTNGITVMATSNGNILAPTNIWNANRTNIVDALAGLVATGTPVYVEAYQGTITGATIVTGAVAGVTTSANVLAFTVPSGGSAYDDTPLRAATNSLQEQAAALQAATNVLDLATNALQIQATALQGATNSLQAQATANSAATNSLQGQATALQAATNSLQSQTASLQSATNVLDQATNALQSQATALQAATNVLDQATNALQSQITAVNPSAWSGYNATQQIVQVKIISVLTNLTVTGTLEPPIASTNYVEITAYDSHPAWSNTVNGFFAYFESVGNCYALSPTLGALVGSPQSWGNGGQTADGTYTPAAMDSATGTATVVYSYITSATTWKHGYNAAADAWQIESNGTVIVDATNVASLAEQVKLQTATNSLNARVDALEVPYQAYTTTLAPDAGGTCTITYASGSLVRIAPETNITVTFDNTSYPTNGVNRVGVEIFAPTNSVAFAYDTITNTTAPAISTSSWTSLFFRRVTTNLWYGRQ